jgi:sporulation protein YlmC with PRC-barrel domain
MIIRTLTLTTAMLLGSVAYAEQVTVTNDVKKTEVRRYSTPRATEFIGMEVYDPSEKKIGTINNIVFEGGENRVGYAVISYGGSDKLYSVPWRSLTFRSDEPKRVYVKEETFKTAPSFEKNKWPEMSDAAFQKEMSTYYKTEQKSDGSTETTRHESTSEKTRADSGSGKSTMWTRRATFVFGAPVKSSDGQVIGEVKDVVLGPDGEARYVVISNTGSADKFYAVPFRIVRTKPDTKEFVIEVSKDRLSSAPAFDKSTWPDWNDEKYRSTVDVYYQKTTSRDE